MSYLSKRSVIIMVGIGLLWPAAAHAGFTGTAEVAQVKFERVRPEWYQIDVEVEVRPAPGNSSRFVDRVRVRLHLGFRVSLGEERWEFYRAESTAVTVEQGRVHFRFYLPPEVVKRDRLAGAADYWAVDLAVAGEAMPRSRRQVAESLPNPTVLANFLAKVASAAPVNDGVLLPQYLTPFAHADLGRGTPASVRPEARAGHN